MKECEGIGKAAMSLNPLCTFAHGTCMFENRKVSKRVLRCERHADSETVEIARKIQMNGGSPKRKRGENDDNKDETDTELSRRVFLAGTLVSTLITATVSYRFFIGDDLETRIATELSARFPRLFSKKKRKQPSRPPLDAQFAMSYFTALEATALDMGLIKNVDELRDEEAEIKRRAEPLFFFKGDENLSTSSNLNELVFTDPDWFNFLLYARLHTIAGKTSPQTRVTFTNRLARKTIPLLRQEITDRDKAWIICDDASWLSGVTKLLQALVSKGWISSFRIEPFDGVAWAEDKHATLTLYASDIVTMQAAQLIGEEAFEEISPKVSPWIKLALTDCGIGVSAEDYYLDDIYRPDPTFYKPTVIATQFDLTAP